jgi:carbonic anhydrase/acetyltransferase-like protein (isoleucine patch superfamily)
MAMYEIGGKRPVPGAGVWIAPSADVIGDAHLGDGASVWFGAVIRADNGPIRVGARTNVQDGAMLHADPDAPLTVGDGCTIGHHAILHGCTIGDTVLIGMGATVLNHATIGADSIVGAGALVTEGKSFAPGSLIVGSPARAVRTLTPEAIAALRGAADGYAARQRVYARDLRQVD